MEVRKILDVGSSDPIVARLSFQWFEIFRWFDMSNVRKNKVLGAMFEKVQPRVVECSRISRSIGTDVDEAAKQGLVFLNGGRDIQVPSVIRLSERAEDYLSNARRALRDFGEVFDPLLGRGVRAGGNYAALSKWSECTYGSADPLSQILKSSNESWIRKLCDMRDAVEHPTGPKGPIFISNFAVDVTYPKEPVLCCPSWFSKGYKSEPIAQSMAEFDNALLLFFEETLMAALRHVPVHVRISFVEIPEKDRDPNAPVRFVASSDGSVLPNSAVKITEQHTLVHEAQRVLQQGHSKPILAQKMNGVWFVAVGNTLHRSDRWKTFPDFLNSYLKIVIGGEWANLDLKKPREQRHPLMNWYQDIARAQQKHRQRPGIPTVIQMSSVVSAYYGLAYNLYLLAHNNGRLQERLIKRLQNREQFFGAYHETVAAGMLIRAGFDLELEDEDDSTTSHCEFTATHRTSGQKFSVEAKIRLSEKPEPDIWRQLFRALSKRALHTRLVFIEVNTAIGRTPEDQLSMMRTLLKDIRENEVAMTMEDKTPAPPAYLVITNNPPGTIDTPHMPAIMIEGFKIPDFRVENLHPTLRAAIQARKRHPAMTALETSMRVHAWRIPSTFDGELSAFAFNPPNDRLVIGKPCAIATSQGEVIGELVDAQVLPDTKKAFCTVKTDQGTGHVWCDLTEQEMAAYNESPETFFGVKKENVKPLTDPLSIYDWFLKTYSKSSKEQLLQFLAAHPDIERLRARTQTELADIYSELMTESIFRDMQNGQK